MPSFTLIIPTHERHTYLHRTLEFYSDLGTPVIYCDSSAQPYRGAMPSEFQYLHLPGLSFSKKMLLVLAEIDTPFVSLCADDDFILHGALQAGAEFLCSHATYKSVAGHYLGFPAVFEGEFFDTYLHNRGADISGTEIKSRTKEYFEKFFILLWAMHDKETLRSAFQCHVDSGITNERFLELMIGEFACAGGGIRVLPQIWGVREAPAGPTWRDEDPRLGSDSARELRQDFVRAVDGALGVEIGEFAFECYLKHHLARHPDLAPISSARKLIRKVGRTLSAIRKGIAGGTDEDNSPRQRKMFPPEAEMIKSDSPQNDAAELQRISQILLASKDDG